MSEIPEPKIIKSRRSTISIQVTSSGEVIVKAPSLTPNFIIKKFINEKKDWILDSLEKIKKVKSIKKEFKEGEKFLYLGKDYILRFGNYSQIKFEEKYLNFPVGLKFRVKKELENFYINSAKKIIEERLKYHSQKMETNYKSVMFSDTKSKWGTCFHDNSLQFNFRLIMAPIMVMDYVIIHELTHTIHKNHGHDFWKMVGKFTPAYKQHRKWLNENGKKLQF